MNPRIYQYKPSADRLGNAPYIHGRLQPLQPATRSFWRRIFRKVM
jgi:hypothetical protein